MISDLMFFLGWNLCTLVLFRNTLLAIFVGRFFEMARVRWNLYLDPVDKELIERQAKEAGVSPSRFLTGLARDGGAAAATGKALRSKLKGLRESVAPVVNDSLETVEAGEVVARPVQTVPEDVVDPPVRASRPSDGLVREVAADDPRLLLPSPVFDPARRRSGFAAYVSPRPGRYRRPPQPSSEGLDFGPHTFHVVDDTEK